MNDECSAFHLGSYFQIEDNRIRVEDYGNIHSGGYNESRFEAGLSGGYKFLINNRWSFNPVAYIGVSNRYQLEILENYQTLNYLSGRTMNIRVGLLVGLRL